MVSICCVYKTNGVYIEKKDLENFFPGSQLDLNLDYSLKFLNASTHLRQLRALSQCFKTEIDILTFWTITFSAWFQISTNSKICTSENLPLSVLKYPKTVKMKTVILAQTKFYRAPHSVSEVTINAEGGARFSPNRFPTSNYFQHGGIPEEYMILHTCWQPPHHHHCISLSYACPVCPQVHENLYFIYFLLSTTSFGKEFQRSVTCCISNSSVLSTTPSSFLWCLLFFS